MKITLGTAYRNLSETQAKTGGYFYLFSGVGRIVNHLKDKGINSSYWELVYSGILENKDIRDDEYWYNCFLKIKDNLCVFFTDYFLENPLDFPARDIVVFASKNEYLPITVSPEVKEVISKETSNQLYKIDLMVKNIKLCNLKYEL